MLDASQRAFRFDRFTLDTARGLLLRDETEIALRRQTYDVLCYLVRHAGAVVSSEELIGAVWAIKPADANASVSQCIKELRREMGEDTRWIIQTITNRGYLFKADVLPVAVSEPKIGDVAERDRPENSSTKKGSFAARLIGLGANTSKLPIVERLLRTPGAMGQPALKFAFIFAALTLLLTETLYVSARVRAPTPIALTMMAAPTVEVRPFKVVESEACRGQTLLTVEDRIRTELFLAPRGFEMIVKSRVSPASQSSREVESDPSSSRYVVDGAAWCDQTGRNVTAQLIEAPTGREIWAQTFQFAHGDALAVDGGLARIARAVTVNIRTTESRRPMPETPLAGHYSLLGRAVMEKRRNADTMRTAEALFEKALALDPNLVSGLQGLAATKLTGLRNGWIPDSQRATTLAATRATIEHLLKQDPDNVGGHFQFGFLMRLVGDVDRAIAAFEHTLLLNPTYALARGELGRVKIDAGRSEEALKDISEAISLAPQDPATVFFHFWAGMACIHIGDDRAAVRWLLQAQQIDRTYTPTAVLLAVAYYDLGEFELARKAIGEHLAASPRFSIEALMRGMNSPNPVAKEQRQHIFAALRNLGVAEKLQN
jgi:DNA-binding winged helix-turn-helix (wHTH) protein/tetratricopeptide (TPR) repeat protein